MNYYKILLLLFIGLTLRAEEVTPDKAKAISETLFQSKAPTSITDFHLNVRTLFTAIYTGSASGPISDIRKWISQSKLITEKGKKCASILNSDEKWWISDPSKFEEQIDDIWILKNDVASCQIYIGKEDADHNATLQYSIVYEDFKSTGMTTKPVKVAEEKWENKK